MKQDVNMEVNQKSRIAANCSVKRGLSLNLPTRCSNGSSEGMRSITGALVGLLARGYLLPVDRQVLDSLGGGVSLSFLVEGTRWHHPDDVPLFDSSLLSEAMLCCGDAVVTQRYRSEADNLFSGYALTSGVLNPEDEAPIVVGILGPQVAADHRLCDTCFGDIIATARKNLPRLKEIAAELRTRLLSDEPSLVVAQSTGQILIANDRASKMCELDRDEIEGMDADELLASGNRRVGRMVRLENELFPISLVTLHREPRSLNERTRARTRHLIEEIALRAQALAANTGGVDDVSIRNSRRSRLEMAQRLERIAADLQRSAGILKRNQEPQEATEQI